MEGIEVFIEIGIVDIHKELVVFCGMGLIGIGDFIEKGN